MNISFSHIGGKTEVSFHFLFVEIKNVACKEVIKEYMSKKTGK